MNTVIFWFRNDLRLHDQPALAAALASGATHLLPWCACPGPTKPRPGALPAWARTAAPLQPPRCATWAAA